MAQPFSRAPGQYPDHMLCSLRPPEGKRIDRLLLLFCCLKFENLNPSEEWQHEPNVHVLLQPPQGHIASIFHTLQCFLVPYRLALQLCSVGLEWLKVSTSQPLPDSGSNRLHPCENPGTQSRSWPYD